MSINWLLDVDPAPALLVLPPAAASLDEAHAAIELWEHYSGKRLDATQRLVVEVMMAETADGKWAAATTGREMPRQNGKGDELEVPELWGLVQRGEAILHTVHDAVLLASQAQQRMLSVLESHADLRRLIKRKWMGTGQQMIEMRNGGTIWYRTRTGGGGRGVDDIDRLVIDEAQHATDEQLAAVAPTLFANSNPQLNAAGTAGLDGRSDWWWQVRKRALSSDPGAFGYVGHTAERVYLDEDGDVEQDPVDVEDRSLWPATNPALAAGRGGGMEFLEEQLRRLGAAAFAREHLCVWDPAPGGKTATAFPAKAWAESSDPLSQADDPVAFAFDVTPDRSRASIVMAGYRPDGLVHGDVVENMPGTGWVVARMVELNDRWKPCAVGVDPAGPAGSLIVPLREAGVEVVEVAGRQMLQACGGLYDDVVEGRFRHLDQAPLNDAVRAAKRRPLGDAWAWARRDLTDISPLVALTVARDVLIRNHKPAEESVGDFIVI